MVKSTAVRSIWVCASCARHAAARRSAPRIVLHRMLSASTFRRYPPSPPPPLPPPPVQAADQSRGDDAILREIFDNPYRAAAGGGPSTATATPTGLFKNRYLATPEGFVTFARRTLAKAERIVDKVLWASTEGEYRAVVRDLDRLSDLLCRVLDLSDFVRLIHPDDRFRRAASAAWALVYQYMNRLNTTSGLSEQLGRALANPAVASSWSEEERAVAEILQLDFLKSAIHLAAAERDRFVWLSQRISEIGNSFCADMAPETPFVVADRDQFGGLHPQIVQSLSRRGGLVHLPSAGAEAAIALRCVRDDEIRRQVYLASRTASRLSVARLEELLALRGQLARLAGFESYGHMALKDRMMAKSPGSVMQFLLALHRHNSPTARAEIADLVAKKRQARANRDAGLDPWDRDYYTEMIRAEMRRRMLYREDDLAAFFSVGTVMQGLSRLFGRLYGIRLVPKECQPGETWHPDVRRLDVVTDAGGGGLVAVIYCDLFARTGKSPNPTHFTVRCSREIATEEVQDAAIDMAAAAATTADDLPTFNSPEEAANDGMETSIESGVLKQLPTIALVCDFVSVLSHDHHSRAGQTRRRPPLLTLHQVETLFHEMGHAAHSILARTSLQNVSGTRCATDVAELPSTLMEHFATDPSVLALFARHWETGAPLPHELVAERVRIANRFEGIATEYQIMLAMVDQAYHSAEVADLAGGGGGDGSDGGQNFVNSTATYHQIQRRYGTPPVEDPATRWQGFFGHLHSYGSTYYSYLFDRVLAERVWRVVFRGGRDGAAVDRANGERLKEKLLKWGGGRDPWTCLADVLADERLATGGEPAMALVGSWGIKEDPWGGRSGGGGP